MFLTAHDLPHYLMTRGLVAPADILDEDVLVIEGRRRNRNFRIVRNRSGGLFFKQISVLVRENLDTLKREATIHELSRTDRRFAPIRRAAVPLLHRDTRRHCLVYELLDGAQSLHVQIQNGGAVPAATHHAIGAALRAIHDATAPAVSDPSVAGRFPGDVPWVLRLPTEGERMMSTQPGGAQQLLQVVKSTPALHQGLSATAAQWQRTAIVHGDFKWDNLLIRDPGTAGGEPEIRIVDWELADVGDPAWDVGCAIGAFLMHWVIGTTQPPVPGPDGVARSHGEPRIEALWPGIAAFWAGYLGQETLDAAALQGLQRVIPFAAARLVLSALESATFAQTLPPLASAALNLAATMFGNPSHALYNLLGFSRVSAGGPLAVEAAAAAPKPPPAAARPKAPAGFEPALEARLRPLLRDIRILSPTQARIADSQTVEVPPGLGTPPWLPAAVPGQSANPAQRLIDALSLAIYAQAYTRTYGDAPPPAPEGTPAADQGGLITRLQAANRSQARWDSGWRVYTLGGNGVLSVEKGDAYRQVAPGQYAHPAGHGRAAAVGDIVDLFAPREATQLQPGFYHAFGETLGSAAEDTDMARLYFNVGPDGAPALMELLTGALNRYFIPFSLKCLVHPVAFGRQDPFVVYMPRRYLPAALTVLDGHAEALGGLLRPGEPLFARALLPGLSGADDPGTGESFGQSRCRLIARGVVESWLDGASDEDARLEAVARCFREDGLRPDAPHLGADMTDAYRPVGSHGIGSHSLGSHRPRVAAETR